MTPSATQPVEADDNIARPDPSAAYGGVRVGHRTLIGYLLTPLTLLAVLVILYLYVSGQELSSGEQRRLNQTVIATATWEHFQLTLVSTVLVLLIAIPIGILLTRPSARVATPPALAIFNVGQAVPSIGLIALLAIVWDIGFWPAVVALVAYTVLPVLRNTMVGLRQVDAFVIESARGMGMTRAMVLAKIELPLAVPIIMAGLRTALTINVGTATLGTFIGAGGLGGLIVAGFVQNRPLITVVGAILVAVLALTVDYVAGIAEELLRPRGL
jgi:osmoprotectant transport system permease protein